MDCVLADLERAERDRLVLDAVGELNGADWALLAEVARQGVETANSREVRAHFQRLDMLCKRMLTLFSADQISSAEDVLYALDGRDVPLL